MQSTKADATREAILTTAAGLDHTKPRDAVVLICTEAILPAAVFAAIRLAELNVSARADVILFTDSAVAFDLEQRLDLPFGIRKMAAPAELARHRLMSNPLFFRFAIPHLLASSYRRTLYLDVDTFVEDERLFGLLDLDMGGHSIAAVRDYHIAFVQAAERQATLGPGNRKYLNAGVMLIDNRRFVDEGIAASLMGIAEARAGSLELHDQSALNMLLRGRWLELSPSFNMLSQLWVSFVRRVYEPIVVHFAGIAKPWDGRRFGLDHRAAHEMRQFLSSAPWKEVADTCFSAKTREAATAGVAQTILGYDQFFVGKSRLINLLREARFADVQQGLITPHFEHLPP